MKSTEDSTFFYSTSSIIASTLFQPSNQMTFKWFPIRYMSSSGVHFKFIFSIIFQNTYIIYIHFKKIEMTNSDIWNIWTNKNQKYTFLRSLHCVQTGLPMVQEMLYLTLTNCIGDSLKKTKTIRPVLPPIFSRLPG